MDFHDYLTGWMSGSLPAPPIVERLGIKLIKANEGRAVIGFHADRSLWNAMGSLHGGVFADLADVAMGVALATVTLEGETFTTTHLEVHFFASVKEGDLLAEAKVIRRGRSTGYSECEIRNESGELVAKASSACVYQVLK